ncbi:hypothetical protein BJ742DRAFT_107381 [Cladochytrium replicatum]|nr:hypothetical protein BJ742DRAFT_107381 [Cladochytrium replicatum]
MTVNKLALLPLTILLRISLFLVPHRFPPHYRSPLLRLAQCARSLYNTLFPEHLASTTIQLTPHIVQHIHNHPHLIALIRKLRIDSHPSWPSLSVALTQTLERLLTSIHEVEFHIGDQPHSAYVPICRMIAILEANRNLRCVNFSLNSEDHVYVAEVYESLSRALSSMRSSLRRFSFRLSYIYRGYEAEPRTIVDAVAKHSNSIEYIQWDASHAFSMPTPDNPHPHFRILSNLNEFDALRSLIFHFDGNNRATPDLSPVLNALIGNPNSRVRFLSVYKALYCDPLEIAAQLPANHCPDFLESIELLSCQLRDYSFLGHIPGVKYLRVDARHQRFLYLDSLGETVASHPSVTKISIFNFQKRDVELLKFVRDCSLCRSLRMLEFCRFRMIRTTEVGVEDDYEVGEDKDVHDELEGGDHVHHHDNGDHNDDCSHYNGDHRDDCDDNGESRSEGQIGPNLGFTDALRSSHSLVVFVWNGVHFRRHEFGSVDSWLL